MGFAKILSGGPDGRYTIELDFGRATRDLAIAKLGVLVDKLQIDIFNSLTKIAEEEAKIVPLRAAYDAAVADYIALAEYLRLNGHLPPGSPELSTVAMDFQAALIKRADALIGPLRRTLDAQRFALRKANQDVLRWTNIVAISTRPAWCTTLKEDAAIGSYAATVDIPGDSNLVLLAPECRAWQPSDGYLRARAVMSPEQAFWNAAVQPGWQKFKPTYRWGTATGINYEANTMTVALFDQKSDAQRLSVNQAATLTNIPVVYMSCDAHAFEIDDRVVVEFQGQDWANPRVIGFLDNPKACRGWALNQVQSVPVGILLGTPGRAWDFICTDPMLASETVAAAAAAGTLVFEYRVNRGAWETFSSPTWYEDNSQKVMSANPGGDKWSGNYGIYAIGADVYFIVNILVQSYAPGVPYEPFPLGSIVEFRLMVGATVLVNVAIQNSASATYLARTRSRILASNAARLTYALFVDTGT